MRDTRPRGAALVVLVILQACHPRASNGSRAVEALQRPPPPSSPKVAEVDAGGVESPLCAFHVDSFMMVDADHGWAMDGPQVFRTSDGGNSWKAVHRLVDWNYDYGATFDAQGASHMWIAQRGSRLDSRSERVDSVAIHRTTNGGAAWSTTVVDLEEPILHMGPFSMSSTRDGRFDIGAMRGMSTPPTDGPTYVTHDGGVTWKLSPRPRPGRAEWRGVRAHAQLHRVAHARLQRDRFRGSLQSARVLVIRSR